MPFGEINIPPGINTQLTETANPNGWSESSFIRFYWGKAQKLGGWTQLTSTALAGVCRGLHGWADISGNPYLAAGTNTRLYIYDVGGAFAGGGGPNLYDATPIVQTDNFAPNFITFGSGGAPSSAFAFSDTAFTNLWPLGTGAYINTTISVGGLILHGYYANTSNGGSEFVSNAATTTTISTGPGGTVPEYTTAASGNTVTVTLPSHGFISGNRFNVGVATTVSGVTISATTHIVGTVINANQFTITGAGSSGGVASAFENSGNASVTYFSLAGLSSNNSFPTRVGVMRLWYLDNFGQLLIGNYTNGPVIVWNPANGAPLPVNGTQPSTLATITPNQATIVATAPNINTASFVIAQAQILVCLGSELSGTQQPLLIRWSDVGDYTDFTPTATNQAGSFTIPTGSRIVAGLPVGLGALIWTDTDLWSMTYQGLPFVFSFQKIASQAECLSGHAVGQIGAVAMWPSRNLFYQFNGGAVTPIECPVWDFFYENLDFTQLDAVVAAPNSLFNEIAWYFPFSGSSTVGYVKYNLLENVWDYGTLTRTAWTDHSPAGNPFGTDQNGLIQQHEIGTDANGAAMTPTITSGYFVIGDGENLGFLDWVLPDVQPVGSPTLQLTIYATNFPGQTPITYGPYTWTPTTTIIPVGIRARQIAFEFSSTDTGTAWRLGLIRYRFAISGRA